jgi:hypothetical protein
MPRGKYTGLEYRPAPKPVMQHDDWMSMTGGGERTSPYSAPAPVDVPRETWLDRFRREAAEFQMKRMDRIIGE